MASDSCELRTMHKRWRKSMRMLGYGVEHQRQRKMLVPFVAAGLASCARCGEPIGIGEPWDLGHDDYDRSRWTGPEHRHCNRATNRLRVSRAW